MRGFLRFLGSFRGAAVLAVVLLVLLLIATDWTAEYLWLSALKYPEVFWTIRLAKLGLFLVAAVPVLIYAFANLRLLANRIDMRAIVFGPGAGGQGPLGSGPIVIISLLFALVVGLALYSNWDLWLRFVHGVSVGATDPLYGNDIGFYLFTVPFLKLVQGWLTIVTFGGLAVTAGLYGYDALQRVATQPPAQQDGGKSGGVLGTISPDALVHVAVNAALFLAAWGFGYWLARFDLLTDPSGAVHGAGYTDVTLTRHVLWLGVVLSVVLIGIVLYAGWRATPRLAGWSVAVYAVVLVVGVEIVPGFYQDLEVEPTELELETPYLKRNIAATRAAFQLDKIQVREYSPSRDLSLADLEANQETIDNIRLWDWRPLSQTFRQLQQIRAYYQFNDVDVDRYLFDGSYKQVLLSARELSDDLPGRGRNWVNTHLQYTHGIGLAMALASDKNESGEPVLVVKDLPPVASVPLEIDRPEIYFGEGMATYRIVNTGVEEFDYPRGDDNVYTNYKGEGGVRLDSAWKVGLFALHQGDISILLSDYINENSRIQFWRALRERLGRLAPFLEYDPDPYLVVSDGRLYWIQDAYTSSEDYPYSEAHVSGPNYLRNSVKVVIDAYNGSVDFYVVEPSDSIIRTYQEIFPSVFKPLEAMPDDLRRHLRYPQRLFEVQADMFGTYHMTVPQVFYNREDVWTVPQEKYGGEAIEMKPYYILMRLPDEERLQFLLMQPLTPSNRDNMIAWMAARSDPPDYGELLVFKLPKERLIFGPIQIEAKIDQDTIISRQLSLWDQRGSRVTRGNLLVIPIEDAFLYVEPVYLLAEGTDIPQLKRVIVSDGEKIAMEPTLQGALEVVFGGKMRKPPTDDPAAEAPAPQVSRALGEARQTLDEAQRALERGDWAAFGQAMQRLRSTLSQPGSGAAGGGATQDPDGDEDVDQ